MTKLDLGCNFDTSKVENMTKMFQATGNNSMKTLNLGNAFKNIAEKHEDIFKNCGANGSVINISEEIYIDEIRCKLNTNTESTIQLDEGSKAKFGKIIVPESISINVSSTELFVDDTLYLQTNINPKTANAATDLTYSSNKPNIARVNEKGIIRGIGEGEATITVSTENGISNSVNVSVKYNELRQAVITVADSYRNRGVNIQYEQRLKTMALSPEEATEDNILYIQCAGFTWDVYYEALGISLPIWCTQLREEIEKNGSEFSIKCLNQNELKKYVEKEDNKEFVEDIAPSMKPGDVIFTSGHLQMVYSLKYDDYGNITDALLIHASTDGIKEHATERQKSYIDQKEEGSVRYTYMSNYYNKDFLKREYDKKEDATFVVLRPTINGKTWKNPLTGKNPSYPVELTIMGKTWENPIDKDGVETYTITEKAKDRMKYKGIYISKTNNFKNKSVVPANAEIEYTLTLKNQSESDYKNIIIKENIPEGTEYVSGGDRIENGVIIWEEKTIPAGETVNYSFKIKVLPKVKKGTVIISKGKVNNIDTTTVKNIVGNMNNADEIIKLKNAYDIISKNSNNNRTRICR